MKACGYQWDQRDEGPGGCFHHTCVKSLVHQPPHRCQCGSEGPRVIGGWVASKREDGGH